MKKNTNKWKAVALAAAMIISVTGMTACGENTSTPDESSPDTAAVTTVADTTAPTTVPATTAVDKAIAEQGLTVNDKGEVVDKNGKKVETTADGKVKVKTADGKEVELTANEIKTSNELVSGSTSNSSGGSTGNTANSKTTASKTSTGGSGNSKSDSENKGSGSGSTGGGSTGGGNTGGNTSSAQSSAGSQKTYHEAEYKTVHHPAETKTEKVWVVDKEAYTYEKPIYEMHDRTLCNDCNMDMTYLPEDEFMDHLDKEPHGSYRNEYIEIQVGTETVEVPEEGHYETKTTVVKEAWDEQVLVREAGWY